MLRFLTACISQNKGLLESLDCIFSNIDINIDSIFLQQTKINGKFERGEWILIENNEIDTLIVEIDVIYLELLQKFYVKLVCRLVNVENIADMIVLFWLNDDLVNKMDYSSVKYFHYDAERRMINLTQAAINIGDTFEIYAVNVSYGLGSHLSYDIKFYYSIARAIFCCTIEGGIVCENILLFGIAKRFLENCIRNLKQDSRIPMNFALASCTGGRQHGRI